MTVPSLSLNLWLLYPLFSLNCCISPALSLALYYYYFFLIAYFFSGKVNNYDLRVTFKYIFSSDPYPEFQLYIFNYFSHVSSSPPKCPSRTAVLNQGDFAPQGTFGNDRVLFFFFKLSLVSLVWGVGDMLLASIW